MHKTHKHLHKNAKKLNRKIMKRDCEPAPSFTSIRCTDTHRVLTEPAEVLQEAERQMAQAKQAPDEAGRGRTPPWTTLSKGMLPCDLRTATPSLTNTPLLDLLTRECYDRCLSHAQNRRSPGPNGIPNEILKHLHQEFQGHGIRMIDPRTILIISGLLYFRTKLINSQGAREAPSARSRGAKRVL